MDELVHTTIFGTTGAGKTTLMSFIIGQLMKEGSDVAVIDPHGDFIDRVSFYLFVDGAHRFVTLNIKTMLDS